MPKLAEIEKVPKVREPDARPAVCALLAAAAMAR
jgi:hypothetical protein